MTIRFQVLPSGVEKTCTGCGEAKRLDQFTLCKRGLFGRKSKCRACVKKYNTKYRRDRWVSDEEFRRHVCQKATDWAKANPAKRSVIAKRRNKKAFVAFPEKIKARRAVNQRVRRGIIPPASDLKCHSCGHQSSQYHHWKGYAFENRLDVVPVCISCHKKLG